MENNFLNLADIPTGKECVIVKVHGHGSFRNRIVEMGFVKGETVSVIKNAPLHDPIEYKLMDGHISLRRLKWSVPLRFLRRGITELLRKRKLLSRSRKNLGQLILRWSGIRTAGRPLFLTGLRAYGRKWGIIAG